MSATGNQFRILTLDGGGAKGFYTLGFLRELEALLGTTVGTHFDAVYGTSTGSIIAALIANGVSIEDSISLYREKVVSILGAKFSRQRSEALRIAASDLFGDVEWGNLCCDLAIVTTNWTAGRPLIFKSSSRLAHGMISSFSPGFGRPISEAVCASCSATPFFKSCKLELENVGAIEARDGGFSANNPSLFALTDALSIDGIDESDIRLLSVGVGHYPTPRCNLIEYLVKKLPSVRMLEKTLETNATSTEILVDLIFPNLSCVRIDDRFESPDLATDLLETDLRKLDLLIQRGRESFGKFESNIQKLLSDS